jgi:diacylglycerol kinase family enzyme
VWSCEATEAEVSSKPWKRIIVDGENSGKTPLKLSIRSQALQVLIPADGNHEAEP